MKLTEKTFPALRHRNFRLFWSGQCISLIGTWMQNVGQAWLVLQLTRSAWLLGVVSALQFAPMFFFALFAGVIIDRYPKRKILIITQSILMLQAFVLAALVWAGAIRYWQIVVLAVILGLVTTIDHPTRQAYVVEMVGKTDLMNAIALNSSIFNAARVVGPALAGILMTFLSLWVSFLVNGLSFIAVLVGLTLISDPPRIPRAGRRAPVLAEVKEGLRFARGSQSIASTLLLMAVVSIFGVNFNVLVPVFAQGALGQSAGGYGFLVSSLGLGALAGAVTLAAASRSGPKTGFLRTAALALGIMLILLGLQKSYWVSLVLLALAGWAMIVFNASANTSLQISTPDHLRGRVMSLFSLVFVGFSPFGSLYAGGLARLLGAGPTFVLSGAIVVVLLAAVSRGRSAGKRSASQS